MASTSAPTTDLTKDLHRLLAHLPPRHYLKLRDSITRLQLHFRDSTDITDIITNQQLLDQRAKSDALKTARQEHAVKISAAAKLKRDTDHRYLVTWRGAGGEQHCTLQEAADIVKRPVAKLKHALALIGSTKSFVDDREDIITVTKLPTQL